jgi:hypothetical protein
MRTRLTIAMLSMLVGCQALEGQTFVVVHRDAPTWACRGVVWLDNSSLFCKDWKTNEIAKLSFQGGAAFDALEVPQLGSVSKIAALAEDADGVIYAADGTRILVYSRDGKYKTTISPGVQMAQGIAVLDTNHIFVSGHVPLKAAYSPASIFLVGAHGVERSFSSPFFAGKSGLEDLMLNTASFLALDRKRQVLYQVSQNLYEIRAFDLQGNLIRKIVPPTEYANRPPNLIRSPQGGIGIGPSDTVDDIAVLPDGKLAVSGSRVKGPIPPGQEADVTYERFLDIYDSAGIFRRRFLENELQIEGLHFWGIDHHTGRAYFAKGGHGIEAEVR